MPCRHQSKHSKLQQNCANIGHHLRRGSLEWPIHQKKNKRSRRISAPLGSDQQGSPKPQQLETRNKKKIPTLQREISICWICCYVATRRPCNNEFFFNISFCYHVVCEKRKYKLGRHIQSLWVILWLPNFIFLFFTCTWC
jgi:hypothetical protein